jgi:GGDEF domain-containing protein
VRVRDLLKAAAHEGRLGRSWRAPVTGLPARIRADQHLMEMIRRAGDPMGRIGPGFHADAAFIDIKSFADYNAAFGYELGDRLIRSLSDLIASTVVAASQETFLAHLGEDRFLVTAPAGQLEPRLQSLVDGFDRQARLLPARGLVGPPNGFAAGLPCPRMCLRVLFLPDVFSRVNQPRDVYRLEQQLRSVSTSRSGMGASGSYIIRDWRRDSQRKSA